MKAFVVAAGPCGVPVAEELVRACWSIETLYYEAFESAAHEYAKFQKQVSFSLAPIPPDGWAEFWRTLQPVDDAVLFMIGCPEPPGALPFDDVYSLQPGLLPQQAGPDVASWAIVRGDVCAGVTLFRRGTQPYSGDLLFQEECSVTDRDDVGTIEKKLAELAVKIVRQFWEKSTRAQLRPTATFASTSLNPPWRDGPVPWTCTTREIHNFVRACAHPRAGAFTYLKGRKLTVWKTTRVAPRGQVKRFRPGEIYSFDPFRVWTADGWIKLDRVQWEGEDEMPGTDFARTRGIEAGLVLESPESAGGVPVSMIV